MHLFQVQYAQSEPSATISTGTHSLSQSIATISSKTCIVWDNSHYFNWNTQCLSQLEVLKGTLSGDSEFYGNDSRIEIYGADAKGMYTFLPQGKIFQAIRDLLSYTKRKSRRDSVAISRLSPKKCRLDKSYLDIPDLISILFIELYRDHIFWHQKLPCKGRLPYPLSSPWNSNKLPSRPSFQYGHLSPEWKEISQ